MLRTFGFAGLLLAGTAAALLPLGCTLITDVDRSKIPEPPAIEPDPVPETDAGAMEDAGEPEPEPDAAVVTDAAVEPDAGDLDAGTQPDAQPADGG